MPRQGYLCIKKFLLAGFTCNKVIKIVRVLISTGDLRVLCGICGTSPYVISSRWLRCRQTHNMSHGATASALLLSSFIITYLKKVAFQEINNCYYPANAFHNRFIGGRDLASIVAKQILSRNMHKIISISMGM